jgi:outer membrane protein
MARLLASVPSAPAAEGPVERHPLAVARRAAIDAVQARDDVLATTTRPRLFVQSSVFARGTGANVDGTLDGGAAGLGLERANWAVGLQVVFPNLFDVPAVRARRAATAATMRAETAHYDDGLLAIAHERRVAEAAIDAARAVALNTPVQLDAARVTEQQARARFAAGLTSVIEIAEAQNLLATAEYQDAAARVEVWRALLSQAVASGDLATFIALVRQTGTP